jgi:hypothetical protein
VEDEVESSSRPIRLHITLAGMRQQLQLFSLRNELGRRASRAANNFLITSEVLISLRQIVCVCHSLAGD